MASSDPEAAPQPGAATTAYTLGGIVLAIAALYLGKDFFIPFALAGLLAFALSPIIDWLRRWRLPRVVAVLVTVALAFSAIGALSFVVTSQLFSLADSLPTYQRTMVEKVRSLRQSSTKGGVVERLTSSFEEFRKELTETEDAKDAPEAPASTAPSATPTPEPTAEPTRKPVPVTVVSPEESPIALLTMVLGPLIDPLITGGVVVVFVIFVLLERESLRERFLRLVGAGDLQTSTEALKEAGTRVSRYLLMQLIVNVTYGVPLGIGLYLIGVPNALLWGLLAIFLRFIPYLGPILAAAFPAALAFAVDPGWSMLVWVIGLFLVLELVSNNFVEPWLYGSSTGLSALAVISAAVFWTILWGPVGLLLSTPLTVCLVVIGRYVPQLQFLGVLLGSDSVFEPQEQLYQRLLAGNEESAVEMAEDYVDEHSSTAFYDQVAVPALLLAEQDQHRNPNDGRNRRLVAQGMITVAQEIADHVGDTGKAAVPEAGEPSTARAIGVPALCIGGKTELDLAAAEIVAQLVQERGIGARVLPPISINQQTIGQLELRGAEVVCLTYLAPEPQSFAKIACRRIKRRAPHIKIVVCLCHPSASLSQARNLPGQLGSDAVTFSATETAKQIDAWVAPHISAPMQAAPIPENEKERLAALRRLDLQRGRTEQFDQLAAKVAAAFKAPIALVSLVDEEHQQWPGATGLPPKLEACRFSARETSICGHVVATNEILVVEDTAKDARFANNPFLIDNGIRFYAGAPLRTDSGHAIGTLCVIDIVPRTFSEQECVMLRQVADEFMVKLEALCQEKQERSLTG